MESEVEEVPYQNQPKSTKASSFCHTRLLRTIMHTMLCTLPHTMLRTMETGLHQAQQIGLKATRKLFVTTKQNQPSLPFKQALLCPVRAVLRFLLGFNSGKYINVQQCVNLIHLPFVFIHNVLHGFMYILAQLPQNRPLTINQKKYWMHKLALHPLMAHIKHLKMYVLHKQRSML